MLKISEGLMPDGSTIVRIEGQVIGPWVMEVQKYCERFLDKGLQLTLDVGEVSFLDKNGVDLFKQLMKQEARFINYNPFLAELLKAALP